MYVAVEFYDRRAEHHTGTDSIETLDTALLAGLVKPLAFVAQPFHLRDLLVTEIRAGGQRLVDFCHSPGASQRLLAAAPRLPSRRASQHVPVHAGHW